MSRTMFFELKYGKGKQLVEIPDFVKVDVIGPARLPVTRKLPQAVISALEDPIASPPLRNLLRSEGEVAIVVSDNTRPCEYPAILPLLLDYLNASGVPDSAIFLLVAYGAHVHHSDEDNRSLYGDEVLSRVRLLHHGCRDAVQLVGVGETSRGTSVRLNKQYLEAATSIVVASVSFHYFAGFGGGRKAIFPGLASEEGILHNHRIFVESSEGSLLKMRGFKGNIESNPLNDDLMEAVSMAPPSFVVNVCLNQEGKAARIVAGGWKESHLLASKFVLQGRVQPKQEYDLVIAGCGGHPKDINFIQSHKTIDNAFDFVRRSGTLVVLASCEDGVGSASFVQWFKHRDTKAMRDSLLADYSMNGGTALALKMKLDVCRICLHSSLGANLVRKMGLSPIEDMRQDLARIVAEEGVRSAAILPEGSVTVAALRSGA